EVGLCAVVFDRKRKRETRAVGRIFEIEGLAEAVAESAGNEQDGRSGGGKFVAAGAVARIDADEAQVRLEVGVSKLDADFVGSELLERGFDLGTIGESGGQGGGDVGRSGDVARLELLDEIEVEGADGGVAVGADGLAKIILSLFEEVFGLNDADAAGR